MNAITPALELKNVARSYAEGKGRLDVFKDLNLTVRAGEIVALVGQSGSGKSSLLHIAGLLEAPTAGEVFIAGQNCEARRQGEDADPPDRHRVRVSVPSLVAGVLGRGECDDAAIDRRLHPARRKGSRA